MPEIYLVSFQKLEYWKGSFDYQPLFGKWARVPARTDSLGEDRESGKNEPMEEEEVDKFPTHCLEVGPLLAKDLDREWRHQSQLRTLDYLTNNKKTQISDLYSLSRRFYSR